MPSYATLCDLAQFRGYAGTDEVYELDGRYYAVTDDPGRWDLGRFHVYAWRGSLADLELEPAVRADRWNASAA
jgi:hypothetical protein